MIDFTIDYSKYLQGVQDNATFTKQDLIKSFRDGGYTLSEASFNKELKRMVINNHIKRERKNVYSLNTHKSFYRHLYSEFAIDVATIMRDKFCGFKFNIFELIQLNGFVNHMIGQNTVYLFTERAYMPFAFSELYDIYPGQVLLDPSLDIYRRYWCGDMIIILPLITQAPVDKMVYWHENIEKFLVDIVAEPLIRTSFADGEYTRIFRTAFEDYQINTSQLFRYAGRRHVDSELRDILNNAKIETSQPE